MARSCPAISANFVSIVARTAGDSSGCGSGLKYKKCCGRNV
ncbi:MAG: SEC-C domain-containing protein [Desulfovibrio sp.]|nr:SEC-C domain-containing protein [Desulfovibrio sp.]